MSNTSNDPLGGLFQSFSAMAGSLPGMAGGSGPAPLVALLVQAHVASSASLLRAGQRGSESWLQYLKEAGAEAPLEARVDAARGHLRRLAEIAADEARQVAHQLQGLDEQLRDLVADPPVDGDGADGDDGGVGGIAGVGGVSGAPVRRARGKL
jgi:hypothetical protein